MIGTTELLIIAVVAGIFFFGKGKVVDWARGIGEARKAYSDSIKEAEKK